jgi:type II secretory pathway pseudopilin PulG
MEVTLIVVTLLSIALAIAMGILTWRLLQEERLRSDARVAALEQGLAETMQDAYVTQASRAPSSIAASSIASSSIAAPSVATSKADAPPRELFVLDDTDWLSHFPSATGTSPAAPGRPTASTTPIEARPIETSAFAIEGNDSAERESAERDPAAETVVNANGGLFGQVDADDHHVGWPRHVLAVAAVAAVMIGVVIAFWTIGRVMEPAADRAGTIATRTGDGVAANGAVTSALELMSLRQEMQDGTLTISGLVRNPHGGVPQERLTAVVFFFDGQGGFLSSTRAPLDYRALAPGEESPFQLSAPAPAGVARYRVSFRRDEGAVVPHIDRRQQVQQGVQGGPNRQQEASRS